MTSRSPRRLPARFGLVAFSLIALSACSPLGKGPSGSAHNGFSAPSTVKGLIAFTPTDGATELDPAKTEVVVRTIADGATLKSASVQADNGDPVSGVLQGGEFHVKDGLRTDSKYTVTAIAAAAKGQQDRTETSTFSTATTPKVVSAKPASIGEGQSVVVALAPAAGAITLDGPVKGQLSPDGTQVTVLPDSFQVGQTYKFALVARNLNGVAGSPQSLAFSTLPAATVDFSPNPGAQNLGVAIPLTVTLSADAADRADFVSRLAVSATVNTPVAAPGTGVCATSYASPQVTSGALAVTASWLSAHRVRLTPKTADGYWPADSTIVLAARLTGYHTADGSSYVHDASLSFNTGDKRVVDVDLTGQQLTACKNGTQANQYLISSGTADAHASFDGTFYIYRRVADEEMKSPEGPFAPNYYDIKHVPWTQYFDGGAALHGAWWHNNFGHPMSHGCINIQTPTDNKRWPNALPQAEWLYNFDNIGDPVIVHGVTPGLTAAQQKSD
ncbi:MAG TPA: Ig-like domain-containing protein [Candidatus Dormibacteraeota bacterium]|nr:Ig-like domain-containing protein [Candidatus Dormibacteraeota bacterium]